MRFFSVDPMIGGSNPPLGKSSLKSEEALLFAGAVTMRLGALKHKSSCFPKIYGRMLGRNHGKSI